MPSIYFCLTGNKDVDSILLSSINLEKYVTPVEGKYKGFTNTTYFTSLVHIRNWPEFEKLLVSTGQDSVLIENGDKLIECDWVQRYLPINMAEVKFKSWVSITEAQAKQVPSYTYIGGDYFILGENNAN